MSDAATIQGWLEQYIKTHGGVAGSVHLRDADSDAPLALHAAVNIPPKVQAIVAEIPKGKGMAGLAWERDEPVHTCNLKDDKTGDVRPGAKAVDANAAVAIPIHDARGAIRGVVGIAYMGERTISEDELRGLREHAERIPG